MKANYQVVTLRHQSATPAECCAVEFENVICKLLSADLVCITEGRVRKKDHLNVGFFICISMSQLYKNLNDYLKIQKTLDHCILYVFDSWDSDRFSIRKKSKLYGYLQGKNLSLESMFDTICIPFKNIKPSLEKSFKGTVLHVPIGVDTSLSNGFNNNRNIDVFAYGRQPKQLLDAMSKLLNRPSSNSLMYHTNHMGISRINDYIAHRRMFWSMAQNSKIALAFDAYYLNNSRFNFSFVGQRWFESMASGCVILGKRPSSVEMDELFPWENSTIDIDSENIEDSVGKIMLFLKDSELTTHIGLKNAIEVRRRHDWCHRLYDILKSIDCDVPICLEDECSSRKLATSPTKNQKY